MCGRNSFVISAAEEHCGVIEFFISLQTQCYIGKTKHNKKRKISNSTGQYLLTVKQIVEQKVGDD